MSTGSMEMSICDGFASHNYDMQLMPQELQLIRIELMPQELIRTAMRALYHMRHQSTPHIHAHTPTHKHLHIRVHTHTPRTSQQAPHTRQHTHKPVDMTYTYTCTFR